MYSKYHKKKKNCLQLLERGELWRRWRKKILPRQKYKFSPGNLKLNCSQLFTMWISWIIIQIFLFFSLLSLNHQVQLHKVTTWLNVYIYDNDWIMQHEKLFHIDSDPLSDSFTKLWCDSLCMHSILSHDKETINLL